MLIFNDISNPAYSNLKRTNSKAHLHEIKISNYAKSRFKKCLPVGLSNINTQILKVHTIFDPKARIMSREVSGTK
jgi:hypothetical protein